MGQRKLSSINRKCIYDLFLEIVFLKQLYLIATQIRKDRRFVLTHLRLLSNIEKWNSFIENTFWKFSHFLENITAKTNRA